MKSTLNKRKWYLIGALLIPVLLCAFAILYMFQIQLPKTRNTRSVLETALYSITPPPQATQLFCESSDNLTNALVLCDYKTDLIHDQIDEFYVKELLKQGWQKSSRTAIAPEEIMPSYYCKDGYLASLEYGWKGQPYTYSFSTSWGLYN